MFQILGTGSCLPRTSKSNDDLATFLDTSDQWISKRTGIRRRAVCTDETVTQLAVDAAQAALENAGVAPGELDLILCATLRGDFVTPALACLVQRELGAACPAFDLNAACTGFLCALDVAAGYFARRRVRRVLVVAAEAMSHLVDWQDRSTCVLFGDGAGASVLGEGENLLSIHLTCRGDSQPLSIPHITGNSPFYQGTAQRPCLAMDGQEVYRFAVSALHDDLLESARQAGISPQQIDWVLPHQANRRILDAAIHRLGMQKETFLSNIQNTGNMSAASIPLLLDEANRQGILRRGDILALTAFGAGLTTGACILRW